MIHHNSLRLSIYILHLSILTYTEIYILASLPFYLVLTGLLSCQSSTHKEARYGTADIKNYYLKIQWTHISTRKYLSSFSQMKYTKNTTSPHYNIMVSSMWKETTECTVWKKPGSPPSRDSSRTLYHMTTIQSNIPPDYWDKLVDISCLPSR